MKDLCWKQALSRIFVLKLYWKYFDVIKSSQKAQLLPSSCSKPGQQLDNSAYGELNMGQIWFMTDLEVVY